MFQVKGRVLVVDHSNFNLGAKVIVQEDNKILLQNTIEDLSEIESKVISMAEAMDITNIFIVPIAVQDKAKVEESYKLAVSKFSNKKLDKMHFHVI